jgi:hypothetical protein
MTLSRPGAAVLPIAMLAVVCSTFIPPGRLSAQPAGLKIVIIEGEDAVNIIQQKTAVAPIVEVRDRNDQPVAGAVVNFAIRGGRATFGGARTLSVTTNVAGRAVASGFAPTASGAVQISASAAFQGQTVAVTIAQTNVMTAAQAAAVSSAAGSGGGGSGAAAGTGAAGGGGGGLSATTLGIVGAAAAGGVVAATKALGGNTPASYSGQFAFEWMVGCLRERMRGTLTIELESSSDAPEAVVSAGSFSIRNSGADDVSRPAGCGILGQGNWGMGDAPVTGTLSNLEAHGQDTVPTQVGGGMLARSYDFRGALSNGAITGTFDMTWRSLTQPGGQSSGSGPVTLTRVE